MRLAIFTDSFYPELGGIQDSIATTARALCGRGHDLLVCAPAAARSDYRAAGLPCAKIDLGERVRVERLFSLPLPSSTRQSRLLLPTGRRWRMLEGFRPDLIHTHTFLGAGWEALVAARRLQVPLVGTNHWAIEAFGTYVPFAAAPLARTAVRAVASYYDRCDLVTGPSRCAIEELAAHGLRRPSTVVSNPIDTERFRPATAAHKQRLKARFGFSDATVLYAGRLAIEKDIDVLIRSVARLRRDVPNVMLALAGHGTARPRLERLARQLGVAPRVRFLGTLDPTSLSDACRAADVFSIASRSETQSMVLLQAMSSGLPAVGARWRALSEYLPEGAGFLAEPGSAEDFAAKLSILLTRPDLRRRMGERAALGAQRFGTGRIVETWESLYARTLSSTAASFSRLAMPF